ncbi:MAG: HAMP domain-containing sensor histidine kinase, partial [Alphaproteobacteria bacterium]
VSDNIAHDLRTPLTRLRNRLESLRDDEPASGRRDALEAAVGEADGLLSVFGALLRIAQIEAGGRRENFADVALRDIAADVSELYEPVAEEKGLTLTVDTARAGNVAGDRDLLFQALANLVDNAIKYTPAGGTVAISVDAASLAVADSGPGIPPADRDAVFDRFHRLEASRNQPGSGLGLSLVHAVAQLHDGAVQLEDNSPGLRATLSLGS